MAEEFCKHRLAEIQELARSHRPTLFSLCVLNFIFSPVATAGNVLAFRALMKTSSLPAIIKKMLLSLALSDLAVGLFAHSMLAVVFKMALNENYTIQKLCPLTLTLCYVISYFLIAVSFLNITAIAVERLLAVSLHLRYEELVTSKRVVIALVAIWLASCVSTPVIVISFKVYAHVASLVIIVTGFLLTTISYTCVYKVARYHRNQIQNQFQQDNAMALQRQRKCALNVVYIYIVFIACYLPHLCSVLLQISGYSSSSISAVTKITSFLVLLNSSLNPLLYCWRYPDVRQIMKSTLKKILRVPEE